MPFSRVLRNFLIGYAVLHLVFAGVFLFVITSWLREQMLDQTRQRMLDIGFVLREHIRNQPDGLRDKQLLSHIQQLAAETGARFTLINSNGVVLADSRMGYEEIGDHGSRPEVLEAKRQRVGFNERESSTLGIRMIYLAIRLYDNSVPEQDNGFVRVAVEAESIHEAIASLQKFLWMFTIGLGLVAGVLMIGFAAREMRPLQSFAAAARDVAAGQYHKLPAFTRREDEWKSLAEAFSHMRSELAQREASLRENSIRLEAVLGSMIEGVIAIDQHQNVILANQAACEMLDLNRSDLIDRGLAEVIRFPELQQAVRDSLNSQQATHTEFATRGSRRRTLSLRVRPLSKQAAFGAALVLYDVTELRNLETMRRDFVGNVSHELKTPLAAIKAYAETLRLGAIDDKINNLKFVKQIEMQAELLNGQIRDILQLSQVESGRAVFEMMEVNLNKAFLECRDRFAAEAKRRDVSIEVELNEPSLSALADVEALQNILDNLVSNAIRYAKPSGFVKLKADVDEADVDEADVDEDQVQIHVVDNGIGIAPDEQTRIFERFYRVDNARSRDVGGTGLGLAIVKHTLNALGGSVRLESRVGQGSTFTVVLPMVHQVSAGKYVTDAHQ